jgi:hypothetical protein
MFLILAIWEAEIRSTEVEDHPSENTQETSSQQKKLSMVNLSSQQQ